MLGDQLLAARPVAADASIKYLKTGKTDLTATATANSDAETIRKELEEAGKVVFDIKVAITDAEDVTVAEMVVNWHVKKTADGEGAQNIIMAMCARRRPGLRLR
ncbi:MAG: DUF4442 domain-containing protein [Oceanicaulis sp.]|nr:DUF4442 domain-containing protein [Oceanicaulis sp.]